MQHLVNDSRLHFTMIPAPGALEVTSAQVDDATAGRGERKDAVSLAGRGSRTVQELHQAKVPQGIRAELTQLRRQRPIPMVLELRKERPG